MIEKLNDKKQLQKKGTGSRDLLNLELVTFMCDLVSD